MTTVGARGISWRHTLQGVALGLAGVVVVSLVIWAAEQLAPASALAVLYVLPILPVAVGWGVGAALVVAVSAAVAFDLFFFPPLYRFSPDDPHVAAIVVASVVTAVVVSELAGRVRRRAREAEALAREQAALRRVATLVASGAPPEEGFVTVAAEVGQLLAVDYTVLGRYDPENAMTIVGVWTRTGAPPPTPVGSQLPLGGSNVTSLVFQAGRPARIDSTGISGTIGSVATQQWGLRSSVGVPISVDGRLWGVVIAASSRDYPLPADTEARLAGFTELLATAIAGAHARVQLRSYAEEQAALRRVATLVARATPAADVFAAVAAEVGGMLAADVAVLNRYDADSGETVLGAWSRAGPPPVEVGSRWPTGGRNVSTLVAQTGEPTRIDDYADVSGRVGAYSREVGIRASVGVPITVEGRLWGVMIAATRDEPLPVGAESRLAGFTELVATTVANAEAQAALAASRARIVATADTTRRRIERDLHDGAQQRLVSLSLRLRGTVKAAVPPAADALAAHLDQVAAEVDGALDELREIARGLHPMALAQGGLPPALKTLTRRSPVPVDLDVRVDGRLLEPIELAAYYAVSEALTNAAKHAQASAVRVEVGTDEGVLRIAVRDDGRGGADPHGGSGLVGLADRIEALGGRFMLHSPPGEGTAMTIALPLTGPGGPGLPR